jgi:hypothetical protein
MSNKSLIQQIKDCPRLTPEDKETAINNLREIQMNPKIMKECVYEPYLNLASAFYWDRSPQGNTYWSRVDSLLYLCTFNNN